jgi:hypothetical protein
MFLFYQADFKNSISPILLYSWVHEQRQVMQNAAQRHHTLWSRVNSNPPD